MFTERWETTMNAKQTNKGFTIIEVVLVLAIAGLIFLMVFIALPALQSGQRDTARKQDVGNVGTAINNYSSANRGKIPTTAQLSGNATGAPGAGFLQSVSDNVTRVVITGTQIAPATAGGKTATDGVVNVYIGTRCGDVNGADKKIVNVTAGSARQYTIVTLLETGGGQAYCQNS